MDYKKVKKQANEILLNKAIECDYIEYKKSDSFLDKILKTICAYGNNYFDNDVQYIFIGVEEEDTSDKKAIPILPIVGIEESKLEIVENRINELRPCIYPNIDFDVLRSELNGDKYLLIVVNRQSKGPYQVTEKGEKKYGVKPGRYIRIEASTRLAKPNEEFDLIKKFAKYHFCSEVNLDASINDLDIDCIKEYLAKTSNRGISDKLNKEEMLESLNVLDKNDPTKTRIKNFGLLMFSYDLNKFIPYAYVEMIIDKFGTKRKMESKSFKGPIWKQYYAILNYINDNFINTITIRDDGIATNRKVTNFPFVALEELIANAIVHNDYENNKPIQIYVSDREISIVNYNKPLPPLKINDLNIHSFFKVRDTENPEVRDMFKELGIIEDFGTGIGEAKRAMEENGSPKIHYEEFEEDTNVTSVTIPVNQEYYKLKYGDDKEELLISSESRNVKDIINSSKYSDEVKHNLIVIADGVGEDIFGNKNIQDLLKCSVNTATTYIKKMLSELNIICEVKGLGKGKYKFI